METFLAVIGGFAILVAIVLYVAWHISVHEELERHKYQISELKERIDSCHRRMAYVEQTLKEERKEREATGGSLTPDPKSKKIGDDTEIKWSENEKLVS